MMAVYRNIHISFWQDDFVLGLTPEEKYFYLYLMTNSKTNQAGCYEVARRIMEIETGYNRETIEKLIHKFKEYQKIDYCFDTKEILIKNWFKYSWTKSPKVISCIRKDISGIKNIVFKDVLNNILTQYIEGIENIEYEYSTDTVSIHNRNKNKNNHNQENNHNHNQENNIISSEPLQVSEQVVIKFPTNKFNTSKEEYEVTETLYKEMTSCYSAVDVISELNKMRAWLITNTDRRKTKQGMPKFINSWLSKAQDKGGNNYANKQSNTNSRNNRLTVQELASSFERSKATIYADATKHSGNYRTPDAREQS